MFRGSRDSSIGIEAVYGLGRSGFDSRQGQEILLYSTASNPALKHTQPALQWVRWDISPGVKRSEREADQSPPFNAKSRMVELYLHFPIRFHSVVLN
jgi:hypothetical protein